MPKESKKKYNLYAIAAASSKDALGNKKNPDFTEGSKHDKLRDTIAEALKRKPDMTSKPVNPKTGKIIKMTGGLGRTKLDQFISFMKVFRGL